MKHIIYTLALLLLAGSWLTSCAEEDFTTFQGEKSGIYIQNVTGYTITGVPTSFSDSTTYSLSVYPESSSEIAASVNVYLMGNIADYDRPFVLKVNEEKSTAKRGVHFDYDESTCFIPAGKASNSVSVALKRHPDLTESTLRIEFYLESNNEFTTELEQYKNSASWNTQGEYICGTRFKIMFHNKYDTPKDWSKNHFGDWSILKEQHLNTIMGWSHEDWLRGRCPYYQFGYAARALKEELQALADAGTPVMDGDAYMQLGPNYQVDYSNYETSNR